MASCLRTLLVDLRLGSPPSEEVIQSRLVDVLEKEVFAKAKVSRLERVSMSPGAGVQNLVFASDDGRLLMLVRTNTEKDHVALTITLEITAYVHFCKDIAPLDSGEPQTRFRALVFIGTFTTDSLRTSTRYPTRPSACCSRRASRTPWTLPTCCPS